MLLGGGVVARSSAILGCGLGVAIAAGEGLPLVAIEGWKFGEWGWFSRVVQV